MISHDFVKVWSEAKIYWIALLCMTLLSSAIILGTGFSMPGIIKETGNVMLILSSPVLFFVGGLLGNVQGILLIYLAYLLGRKRAGRAATVISCLAFSLLSTVLFYGSLAVLSIVMTGSIEPVEEIFATTLILVIAWFAFSALIYSALHFLGGQSVKKEEIRPGMIGIVGKADFAGFWVRLGARILDEIIIWATLVLVGLPIMILIPGELSGLILIGWILIWMFLYQLYFIYFHKKTGQTIGKKFFGLKVVKEDGKELTWVDSIIRWFVHGISDMVLFLGNIWIAIDKNKQAWHDKAAHTYVVKNQDKINYYGIVGIPLCLLILFMLAGIFLPNDIQEPGQIIILPIFNNQSELADAEIIIDNYYAGKISSSNCENGPCFMPINLDNIPEDDRHTAYILTKETCFFWPIEDQDLQSMIGNKEIVLAKLLGEEKPISACISAKAKTINKPEQETAIAASEVIQNE